MTSISAYKLRYHTGIGLRLCFNALFVGLYMVIMSTADTETVVSPTILKIQMMISLTSRPNALVTVFLRILQNILLNRMHDYLHTPDNPFGFKRAHSTSMPILLLKELLRFYRDHSSNMHVCFLSRGSMSK